jgi:hypothetical protein
MRTLFQGLGRSVASGLRGAIQREAGEGSKMQAVRFAQDRFAEGLHRALSYSDETRGSKSPKVIACVFLHCARMCLRSTF